MIWVSTLEMMDSFSIKVVINSVILHISLNYKIDHYLIYFLFIYFFVLTLNETFLKRNKMTLYNMIDFY